MYAIDMDVGTVQSPAVNVTMPGQRQGRRFRSRIKPLAPMQVPIGANGWILLRGTPPAFCPGINVYPYFADSRVRNAERSMFIPPKVSRGGENFGGINMDKHGSVCHRHGCRNSAKPGCKRHNAGAKAGTPVPAAESKPLAPCRCPSALTAAAGTPGPTTTAPVHPFPSVFCRFKGS